MKTPPKGSRKIPKASSQESPPAVRAIKLWGSRLLLLLGGVAVALVPAEWACRSWFRKNVEALAFSTGDMYYYSDPSGGRRNIPNKVGYEWMWNDDGKAEFRINSLGFRGDELRLPKPSGVFRILFLGDSITIGGRLPHEQIFVERIAQALKAETGARYEVANGGVGDIGLNEEEGILKTTGIRIQPDLVVLGWYLNDARPPVGFPEEIIYRNPLVRWLHGQTLLRKSYLLGLLYDRLRRFLLGRQLDLMDAANRRFQWLDAYNSNKWVDSEPAFSELVRLARYDWGDAWDSESLKKMFDRMRGMRDVAAGHGARFAVIALPEHAQVYARVSSDLADKPQRELAALCREAGIPFLDLLPVLRARLREPLFYDNCHYTPHGNAVVAQAALDFLKRSGVLKY